jgi:hypothetical protein
MEADVDVAVRTGEGDPVARDDLDRSSCDGVTQPVAAHALCHRILEVGNGQILTHHDAVEIGFGQHDSGSGRHHRRGRLGSRRAEEVASRHHGMGLRGG